MDISCDRLSGPSTSSSTTTPGDGHESEEEAWCDRGDRDKRLALVLQGSATAERLSSSAMVELDDDTGKALRTCQDIIEVREKQLELASPTWT